MDLNEATTTYGREFIHDLIDIALITNFRVPPSTWYDLCLRYGLIKRTTKIVRSWSQKQEDNWYYGDVNGERRYQRWETPIIKYQFVLKNGSGKDLLRLFFTHPQMEEWLNETNPNNHESASSVQQ